MLVKFQKWTKLSSLFLTFCIPKKLSLYQNLTSDTPDSLSGLIRSCILSYSGVLIFSLSFSFKLHLFYQLGLVHF